MSTSGVGSHDALICRLDDTGYRLPITGNATERRVELPQDRWNVGLIEVDDESQTISGSGIVICIAPRAHVALAVALDVDGEPWLDGSKRRMPVQRVVERAELGAKSREFVCPECADENVPRNAPATISTVAANQFASQ